MDDLVVVASGDNKLELTHEIEHPLAAEEWLASRVLECIPDPRAVCRLALINKNFSAASVSDLVWQKLLPPSSILDPLLAHVNYKPLSKKHLYMFLCNSITYDNGLKKFWLDPATGEDCHMISAKALSIVWGNTTHYWQWKPYPSSMFSEVACLRSVCWFDVNGNFQHLFRPGRYMISFRLQLHSNQGWRGFPIKLCVQNTTYAHPPHESEVFFDSPPFKIRSCPLSNMFATSPKQATFDSESLIYPWNGTSSEKGGEIPEKKQGEIEDQYQMQDKSLIYPCNGTSSCDVDCQEGKEGLLSSFSKGLRAFVSGPHYVKPMKRQTQFDSELGSYSRADDNENEAQDNIKAIHTSSKNDPHIWVECDVGEFFVEDDNENRPIEVHFSMKEVEGGRWKGGLLLDGVIIRPSYVLDNTVDEKKRILPM